MLIRLFKPVNDFESNQTVKDLSFSISAYRIF